MNLQIENRLALVTGSTMGIGKAIAYQLAENGVRVIVHGRNETTVSSVVQEFLVKLPALEGKLFGVVGDIGTADGCTSVIHQVNLLGHLDILVNNVGVFAAQEFVETSDEDWQRYFDVNIMSSVRLCRCFMSPMKESNWGRIVIISSEAGMRPIPHMLAYSVSKTALIGLARGLAECCKGTNVTVNSVLAGPTWTEGVKKYFDGLAEMEDKPADEVISNYFDKHEPTSLIHRLLTVDEVASVTCFLCSNLASGITGHAQRVEGGVIRCI